ncbi:MAG: hypothetical protein WC679_12360 [Bacteroidales bacterium]|jgi:ferredoxin-fold anticodon binding domain-containing protein
MDIDYIRQCVGKQCSVSIENGFYYKGKVLSVGEDYLIILDKVGKKVFLSLKTITRIEEIE